MIVVRIVDVKANPELNAPLKLGSHWLEAASNQS